jgi:hypothetical protein
VNLPRPDYGFFALLCAGVFILVVAGSSPFWYLPVFFLILTGGVLYTTRTWRDRALYLLCAGQPLAVACGAVNLWAGLFAEWMLAGIVLDSTGMLGSIRDLRSYAVFCGATLVIAAGIHASNHVLLPLIVLGTGTALFAAIQTIRDYRIKKQYAGGQP